MKNFFKTVRDNLLLVGVLFLLFFIPLYPKLPLLGVAHTWVYVRTEDFFVSAILALWFFLLLFNKVRLKSPLTRPILLFWVIGAISTFHGVLIIFPTLANVFSNVAFLSFLRHIEYLGLFFVAYSSIRNKKNIYPIVSVLIFTLISVTLYGLGQKFLGFPAFLTGNEEFAKGVPLTISSLGRITSTFAGHYDLAAYLVLVIPITVSLIFGIKNFLARIILISTSVFSFWLLFMTVSRISFFALLVSLIILVIFQKKKYVLIILGAITLAFFALSPALQARFGNTVKPIDVLVDARSGAAVGQIKEVNKEYLKDKTVLRQNATVKDVKNGSSTALVAYTTLPDKVDMLIAANAPNGENLPQGTGYINLSLSPIVKRTDQYFVEKIKNSALSNEVHAYSGNFLIKEAKAYDLSFTTRFQGEWPRTFESFKKDIFIGSGYGSVSLAVDNNFLRILGETGVLGFLTFLSLFLIPAIYIKNGFSKIDSPIFKSLILGFIAGSIGLLINAFLIDVFEASKVAYTYWILMGLTLGVLHLYNDEDSVNILVEIRKALTSVEAVIIYIFISTVVLLFPGSNDYFVGDDYTWLRWAAETKNNLLNYFVQSDGFFYRPGAKLYFWVMYHLIWLNQTFYHFVSIILDFAVVSVLFLVLRKIFKRNTLALFGAIIFLLTSSYHEAVLWISSTGILFTALFSLSSLLSFIKWKESKNRNYLVFSIALAVLGFLFHELGVVTPFILIAYDLILINREKRDSIKNYVLLLLPILPYLLLRFISNSHWSGGDYGYNIAKLPFNISGNLFGYFFLNLLGPQFLNIYESLRISLRDNLLIFGTIALITIFIIWKIYKAMPKIFTSSQLKIMLFGLSFFVLSLAPFLGLGNITSRYSFFSTVGFAIVISLFAEKIFEAIFRIGDRISSVLITILAVLVFSSFQLFQFQKVHSDWQNAGRTAEIYLISFESIYKDYWIGKPMHFYFVNVPIKNGDAWIFPVGFKDALWFILQNDKVIVDQVNSPADALNFAKNSNLSDVFIFDRTGIREIFSSTDITNKK